MHEVRSRPHPERPAVGFGLVTEEDAGEQGERIRRDLVGALPHVPVDVRAAGAVAVGRDVQRDLDVTEDQLEGFWRGQLFGDHERCPIP